MWGDAMEGARVGGTVGGAFGPLGGLYGAAGGFIDGMIGGPIFKSHKRKAGMIPKTPHYKKLKYKDARQVAEGLAQRGYAASDKDFQERLPELYAAQQFNSDQIAADMRGDVPSAITDAVRGTGFMSEAGKMSGNRYQQARHLGIPVLAKESRDRNYFEELIKRNKPRGDLTLGGKQLAQIAIGNTNNAAVYSNAAQNASLQQQNVNTQQNAQNMAALGNILSTSVAQYAQGQYNQNNIPSYTGSDSWITGGGRSSALGYG